MNKEGVQITAISFIITIAALIAIIAHIMKPTMMIDNITLWLIVIAVVPWLAPVIKSIEWGGIKLEFQERLKKLETDTIDMHKEMEDMAESLNSMMENSQTATAAVSFTSAFIHIAADNNTKDNFTIIDHPATNNNHDAILMVTQNWSPYENRVGVYNLQSIGVWYTNEN